MRYKKTIIKILAAVFWLGIWEILARITGSSLLLPSPFLVLHSFTEVIGKPGFLRIVSYSLTRIWAGFFVAFFAALSMGMAAYRITIVRVLLQPVVTGMKSIPIAAFIILALIWIGPSYLTVLTSVMVTFPVIYINTIEGLDNRDLSLLEMASVFRFSFWKRLFYLNLTALYPFLLSGAKASIGMCWKSGIAAEVIGIPRHSIGEQFYNAKLYLNTTELFAWTVIVVALSICSEKIFIFLLESGRSYGNSNG